MVHARIAGLVQFAALALVAIADTVIVPGAPWTDTSGNRIQAHGGGLLKVCSTSSTLIIRVGSTTNCVKVGSTFYWHGEDKSHNSGLFKAVSCYSVRALRALVAEYRRTDGPIVDRPHELDPRNGRADAAGQHQHQYFNNR